MYLLQTIVLSESLEIWLGQKTLQLAGACFCKKSSLFNTYVGAGGCSPTFAWWAAALSWTGIWVFRLEQPGMGASQPWYFPIARHNFTLDLQISNVSLHWLPADEPELTHVKFKTAVGFSELCQARDNGLCKSRQVQNLIESLTFKSLLKTHNITLKLKFDFCFLKFSISCWPAASHSFEGEYGSGSPCLGWAPDRLVRVPWVQEMGSSYDLPSSAASSYISRPEPWGTC